MFSRLKHLMHPTTQHPLSPSEINGDLFRSQKRRSFSAADSDLSSNGDYTESEGGSTFGSSNLNEYMQELVKLAEF